MGFSEPKQALVTPPASDAGSQGGTILLPVISRLGLPMAIFGCAFLACSAVLIALTSPDRFPVHIGGKIVHLSDLEREAESLQTRDATIAREREKLKSESSAPVLHEVRRLKSEIAPVGSTLMAIDDVRRSFIVGSTDPISLPIVEVGGSGSVITIGGEVRDSEHRSIQLLASFVDGLRGVHRVGTVSEPEYVERAGPGGTTVSPFTITITLLRG